MFSRSIFTSKACKNTCEEKTVCVDIVTNGLALQEAELDMRGPILGRSLLSVNTVTSVLAMQHIGGDTRRHTELRTSNMIGLPTGKEVNSSKN